MNNIQQQEWSSSGETSAMPPVSLQMPGLLKLPAISSLDTTENRLSRWNSLPLATATPAPVEQQSTAALPVQRQVQRQVQRHRRWISLPSPDVLFYRSVPVLMTGAGIICLWIETESFSAWPRLLAFSLLCVFCLLYLFGLWSRDRLTRLITVFMLLCAFLVSLGFLYQSVAFMQQSHPPTEYVSLQHDQLVVQGKQAGVRIGRIWSVRGAGETVYYFQVVGEAITTYRLDNVAQGAQLRVGQVVNLSYQAEQSSSANSDIALVTSLQVVSSK